MTETISETEAPGTDEPVEAPETPSEPDETETAPEEGETPEEPQEPVQEPETPSLDAQKNIMDKAQKKAESYVKGVVDLLEPAGLPLSGCPRCGDFLPGFVLPMQLKPVTEEQRVAVKVSMGEEAEPIYKQAEGAFTCPKCDGKGRVKTGADVKGQKNVKCLECDGRGWGGPLAAQIANKPAAETYYEEPTNGAVEVEKPATDPWGRLRSDPLYGVMPGFEPE